MFRNNLKWHFVKTIYPFIVYCFYSGKRLDKCYVFGFQIALRLFIELISLVKVASVWWDNLEEVIGAGSRGKTEWHQETHGCKAERDWTNAEQDTNAYWKRHSQDEDHERPRGQT